MAIARTPIPTAENTGTPAKTRPEAKPKTAVAKPQRTATPANVANMPTQNTAARGAALSTEQLLISSVLNKGDLNVAVTAGVTPAMFKGYTDEWKYLQRYYKGQKKSPTLIAFRQVFPDFSLVRTADDTGHLAETLIHTHAQDEIANAVRDTMGALRAGNVDDAVAQLLRGVRAGQATTVVHQRDTNVISDYDEVLAHIEEVQERVNTGGFAGVPSGFPTLDSFTGGAKPGEFVVVAARLGIGKSQFMGAWATEAVCRGKTAVYNALEMTKPQMAARFHSQLSARLWAGKAFNSQDLTIGNRNLDMDEYRRFLAEMKSMVTGQLIISDTNRGQVGIREIERQVEQHNPDVVFIDLITLMKKNGTDWQAVGEVSGQLKVLAREAKIPIIVASQLNRNATSNGKVAAGSDTISQSDQIGQDADVIITMTKPTESAMKVSCVKNRHGRGGFDFYTEFRPGQGLIREISYDRFEEIREEDADAADDKA